ncbi:uncharacterized protein cusr [Pristis pectinata]|uniref:uncharacterized protein cusr n=1 Tax=Pristis pectinata TaxID=685728 RepID=UPI00223D2104|nr:uncharacterized protein cusr [Pristis pectinata]
MRCTAVRNTIVMASLRSVVLVAMFASVSSERYTAEVNMATIKGTVEFNTTSQQITIHLLADCARVHVSLHGFPVMYGNSKDPCDESNVGEKIYEFTADGPNSTLMDNQLFQLNSDLSDLTLVIVGCQNGSKACATVRKDIPTKTWQAKFFTSIAGDVYIRQNAGESQARVLSNLMAVKDSQKPTNVTLYLHDGATSCPPAAQISGQNKSSLGKFKVGTPLKHVKSRFDLVSLPEGGPKTLYMYDGAVWSCTEVHMVEAKQVWAYIDMKGVKGTFSFRQVSPFDATYYNVSLENLRQMASAYHVHNFPLPQRRTPDDNLCVNDNLGGHLNPFGKNSSSPFYPQSTNETHDQYEVGDLSGRHGFLKGKDMVEDDFKDWNLPLFGRNSIIGRSVIIHHPNSSRWVCGTIGYPGEVLTAAAIFTSPVSGRIIFRQLKSNPYSDLSIFMDLSYTNSSALTTADHFWYINKYPISSESDLSANVCSSTKGHFNPFKVDVGNNYSIECSPDSPFRCEVGDLAKKHKAIKLTNRTKAVDTKYFFTDTTSSLAGPSNIVPRSVVILGQNPSTDYVACANVTILRPVSVVIDSWKGIGKAIGKVAFKQLSDLDHTVVEVNLTDLNNKAGTYSIHTLPIKAASSSTDACSVTNVDGRYNPFNVNGPLTPAPGNGTVDLYEVGDISGKFGTLNGLNQTTEEYMDRNMPLFGPHSILNRSLVIYQEGGSPLQCANLLAAKATEGEFIQAKAVFSGLVTGTITLSQQVFPDGSSSDTTMEVALEQSDPNAGGIDHLMWHVHTYPLQSAGNCSGVGGHYNPYYVDIKASYKYSCSLAYPLHCEVGDLNSKQGPISLGKRYLKTDVYLPLTGDFTVVGRSVVIHNNDHLKSLKDCADIVAGYPVKSLTFPNVSAFNRYEFRSTVADALGIAFWRVTILPGGPSAAPVKGCQQITFYVAGNVDKNKMDKLEQEDKMGKFKASKKCTADSGGTTPGLFLNAKQFIFWIMTLMLQLVLYSVFE